MLLRSIAGPYTNGFPSSQSCKQQSDDAPSFPGDRALVKFPSKHEILTQCCLMLAHRPRRWSNIKTTLRNRVAVGAECWTIASCPTSATSVFIQFSWQFLLTNVSCRAMRLEWLTARQRLTMYHVCYCGETYNIEINLCSHGLHIEGCMNPEGGWSSSKNGI